MNYNSQVSAEFHSDWWYLQLYLNFGLMTGGHIFALVTWFLNKIICLPANNSRNIPWTFFRHFNCYFLQYDERKFASRHKWIASVTSLVYVIKVVHRKISMNSQRQTVQSTESMVGQWKTVSYYSQVLAESMDICHSVRIGEIFGEVAEWWFGFFWFQQGPRH